MSQTCSFCPAYAAGTPLWVPASATSRGDRKNGDCQPLVRWSTVPPWQLEVRCDHCTHTGGALGEPLIAPRCLPLSTVHTHLCATRVWPPPPSPPVRRCAHAAGPRGGEATWPPTHQEQVRQWRQATAACVPNCRFPLPRAAHDGGIALTSSGSCHCPTQDWCLRRSGRSALTTGTTAVQELRLEAGSGTSAAAPRCCHRSGRSGDPQSG